ncbi:MAG: hypothetical protein K2X87_31620 [Gemmataceae bacterium]|nr:hypothetical protein [Gemmataceae bacterium]
MLGELIGGTSNIRLNPKLVDRWETLRARRYVYGLKPVEHFEYLDRVLMVTVVHELVHHLQHSSAGGPVPDPTRGHFVDTFHREAFGPLWPSKYWAPNDYDLRQAGVP